MRLTLRRRTRSEGTDAYFFLNRSTQPEMLQLDGVDALCTRLSNAQTVCPPPACAPTPPPAASHFSGSFGGWSVMIEA